VNYGPPEIQFRPPILMNGAPGAQFGTAPPSRSACQTQNKTDILNLKPVPLSPGFWLVGWWFRVRMPPSPTNTITDPSPPRTCPTSGKR